MHIRSAILLFAAANAFAGAITIQNPSFESPAQSPGGFNSVAPDGWSSAGIVGVWYEPGNPYFNQTAPDGNQIAYVGFGSDGELTQSLGVTLQANTLYTLTYFLGRRLDEPFGTYAVNLDAGSTVLASDTTGAPGAGNFIARTVTYQTGAAPAAGTLSLDILSSNGQAAFDKLSSMNCTSDCRACRI